MRGHPLPQCRCLRRALLWTTQKPAAGRKVICQPVEILTGLHAITYPLRVPIVNPGSGLVRNGEEKGRMEARFSTVRFLPMVSRAATTSCLSEERPSGDPRGRSARDVLLELDDEGLLLGDDDLYGAANNRGGLRRMLRLRLTGRWRNPTPLRSGIVMPPSRP